MPQFDEFEIRMLEILQHDGRKPVSELAQEIGLSNTPCARRFEALQQAGNIKGFSARLGRRPVVRGVAMNPVDHPHGGGEGRTSGGRHPVTPWGKPTKGKKTRKNKATDKFIIRRRSATR